MATNNSINAPLVANGLMVGNTSGNAYTDVTIADGAILGSVSGIPTATAALTDNAVILGSGTGVPVSAAAFTADGQLLIGNGSSAPSIATLTPGAGIAITNAGGSITIAATDSGNWVDQTTPAVTMAVNTGYTSNDGATLIEFTLPATSAVGDFISINGKGAGLWSILQATGQQIHFGNVSTTLGATGSLDSTLQYDNVALRCLTANTIWTVVSAVGNLNFN